MKKTFITQLVAASYVDGALDEKKVTQIANALKRSELKAYTKALKAAEKAKTVIVESATSLDASEQKELKAMYGNKRVTFAVNPSLIAGIKIMNNDLIYQMNLRNNLDTISSHIQEGYDK